MMGDIFAVGDMQRHLVSGGGKKKVRCVIVP